MKMQRVSRGTARRRSGRKAMAALCGGLVLGGLMIGGTAQALPPDGPGPETPGTSSRVWPAEVRVGDTLNFEVSGYPAGETVYIKIDDGLMCSDTSHGACVYATQKLDGNGYASGSIVVPDLPEGAHWLRMLATGDVFDAKTGAKLGYEGYTRRGGNDFTVVAGGSAGGGGAAGGGGGAGGAAGSDSATVESGELSLDVGDEEEKKAGGSMDDITKNVADGEEPDTAQRVEAAEPLAAGGSLPVIGIAVLGGALVLGGGAVTWALLRRRKLAVAHAADAAASPTPGA